MRLVLDMGVQLERFTKPPTIRVLLDGRELERFVATRPGLAPVYRIPPPSDGAPRESKLEIEISDAPVTPPESRPLGLVVSRVLWDPVNEGS